MGGLLIAGLLERLGPAKAPVGHVATIASPFRGSCEAVIKILTGTAVMGPLQPASREREAARLTPALYHLAPSYSGAVVELDGNRDLNIFDPSAWPAASSRPSPSSSGSTVSSPGAPRPSARSRPRLCWNRC